MKKALLVFSFLFILYFFELQVFASEGFSIVSIKTVGNHSYVVINKDGRPSDRPVEILEILSDFERLNPDKEITGWSIEKQQTAYGFVYNYIYGLWIDHKPKK
ncbi:MAG: hypothetical protein L6Q29_04815 [Candidatus Pacebacteria bacterium]|nr:hypothetical protein [Candidatus Paceibacterota bacterium]NUQ57482.1 hypothetical protein [Candidatus Paceibacter sp.]